MQALFEKKKFKFKHTSIILYYNETSTYIFKNLPIYMTLL